MDYQYFWCEWIIQPLENGNWVTDEGYLVAECVFKAPSKGMLDQVLEEIRGYMNFSGGEPATEQDFSGEPIVPIFNPLDALQAINEAGRRNDLVKQRNQTRPPKNSLK